MRFRFEASGRETKALSYLEEYISCFIFGMAGGISKCRVYIRGYPEAHYQMSYIATFGGGNQ